MKIISLIFATMISGCAGTPLTQSEINEINAPVTCKDKAECDAKWSKAQAFVIQNSRWKIRVATDTIIQTEGPFDEMDLAYSASKIIKNDGSGEINVNAGCGNIFGCKVRPADAVMAFKNYVQ